MMAIPKLDLKKELKHLYQPSLKAVALAEVPPMNFLMIDGKGDPQDSDHVEGPTIEKIHAFAYEQGYGLHKKHHEIYLSDPRRTKPEGLKTVLRQPVTRS